MCSTKDNSKVKTSRWRQLRMLHFKAFWLAQCKYFESHIKHWCSRTVLYRPQSGMPQIKIQSSSITSPGHGTSNARSYWESAWNATQKRLHFVYALKINAFRDDCLYAAQLCIFAALRDFPTEVGGKEMILYCRVLFFFVACFLKELKSLI